MVLQRVKVLGTCAVLFTLTDTRLIKLSLQITLTGLQSECSNLWLFTTSGHNSDVKMTIGTSAVLQRVVLGMKAAEQVLDGSCGEMFP